MNKILDNLQFRVFTDIVKKSEKNGKRRIRGYASTAALDRQGEVITIEALQQAADHLLKNPTVFYEHKHDQYPVGLCVDAKVDNRGLLVDVEISRTADTLWTLIQEGILNRFSIGGRVTASKEKIGEDKQPYNEITGIELFEVSVVGLPANPEARFDTVNKSFSTVIAEEIKKREEDSMAKKEIKKIEEVKVETTKEIDDTLADSQKKDLERYEVEDKVAASKAKEEKEITEKSQEEKPEEIIENKTEKEALKGEKVEEQKEVVKDKKEVAIKEEKVAEEKIEPVETGKVEAQTNVIDGSGDAISDNTSTIQINLLQDKKVDEDKAELKDEKCEECGKEKPAEEKVEEKSEIKVDNSIVTDEEFEKLVVEDISKPYPNEHAARIREPSDFQEGSFRSKPIAEGIRIIIGRLIGETTATVQSYRFHVDYFTAEEAKQWLKDHKITYILFEPATKPEEVEDKIEENKEEDIIEDKTPKDEGEGIKTEEKSSKEKKEDKEITAPVKTMIDEKLLKLLDKLNDKLDALSEKINSIELANQVKVEEKVSEKPKVEEKKEEPKVEKSEEKVEEKPQRKSFIADAPYASKENDEEKDKKDVKKTTDKGWARIVYGR